MRPERRGVPRHDRRALAEVDAVALGHLGIGIGIGRDEVEIVVDAGAGLDLDTAGADLAGLDLEGRVGQVGRRDVGLGQLVDRSLQEGVGARQLVFEAGLVLLPSVGLNGVPPKAVPATGSNEVE